MAKIPTISIPIDWVYTPVKRKKDLNPAKVQEIAESILYQGMEEPVSVRPDGDRFILVDGLHRLEAAKALGEATILAVVAANRPEQRSIPAYEAAAECEREKIARLKKLRLEREAGETIRAKIAQERSTIIGKARSSKTAPASRLRTLSDWLNAQKETGGRY